ncbi:MAG: hypothetical protein ACIAXF_08325 [Phycisphaerales bacterium JB063]
MNRRLSSIRCIGLHTTLAMVCGVGMLLSPPLQRTALGQDDEATAATELPEGHFAPTRESMPFNLVTADDTRVSGKITTYTMEAIHYLDRDDAEQSVAWSEFSARDIERFYPRLIGSADVEGWYRLVELLAGMDEGEEPAERVMRRVERMDPDATDRHESMREMIANGGRPSASSGEGDAEAAGDPEAGAPGDPVIENPAAWPELSDEEQAELTAALQEQVQGYLDQLNMRLGNTQTERFIVFTDLPRNEAHFWVGLLDRMYDKLCEVFDLDEELNIWRGKCVLIMFNEQRDYLRYNAEVFGNNAQGSAGICYQFPNGDVHIFMFRNNDRDNLAHTLVHEAAHGFLFRYKSSHHVPNWLNEGLAEYLAESLLNNGGSEDRVPSARRYVQQRGRLDNFLTARNIIGPHYGIAYDVTKLMIEENRRGYVQMIEGIKEGMSAEESFDERYGASIERVMRYYGSSRLRMNDLRLD